MDKNCGKVAVSYRQLLAHIGPIWGQPGKLCSEGNAGLEHPTFFHQWSLLNAILWALSTVGVSELEDNQVWLSSETAFLI